MAFFILNPSAIHLVDSESCINNEDIIFAYKSRAEQEKIESDHLILTILSISFWFLVSLSNFLRSLFLWKKKFFYGLNFDQFGNIQLFIAFSPLNLSGSIATIFFHYNTTVMISRLASIIFCLIQPHSLSPSHSVHYIEIWIIAPWSQYETNSKHDREERIR